MMTKKKIMALKAICEKYATNNMGELENVIKRTLAVTVVGKFIFHKLLESVNRKNKSMGQGAFSS